MAVTNLLDDPFSFHTDQQSSGAQSNAFGMPDTPSFETPGASQNSGSSASQPSFFSQPSSADTGSSSIMSMQGSQPSGGAQSPLPSAQQSQPSQQSQTPDLSGMLKDIQATTDPAQAAVKRDQLARTLYSQFQDAGHDVKWQGDQLIIDGRPYVVAGGSQQTQVDPSRVEQGAASPAATAATAVPGSYSSADVARWMGNTPVSLPGWDASRTDSDPKEEWGRFLQERGGHVTGDDVRAFVAADPRWEIDPHSSPTDPHIRVKQDALNGWKPGTSIYQDVITDAGGANVGAFNNVEGDPALGYAPPGSGGGPGAGAGGPGGIPASSPYLMGSAPSAPAPAAPAWSPGGGPSYTPGDIPTSDLPNFSYDDLYNQVVGNGSGADGATDSLMQKILANPDSIDAHTLDTMKAKSKDELSEQQQQEEQNMRASGNAAGIDDSNWLASERLASQRGRDTAVVKSNRDLEVTAATTNAADRRAAAQLGATYGAQKAQIRQNAATLAADTKLRQAAATNDRLALRESVNQKAAELGISHDQVMSSWLLGMADDATRRLGINVSAQIDWAKLNEQSAEFKEDLAMRFAQLNQQSEQYNMSYGLDVGQLQRNLDNDAYSRAHPGA